MDFQVDIAILGAGFGGSIAALILQRLGLRIMLLDRGRHPRFAIGESSTPIANLVLRQLAERYDLTRLLPLTKYGPWQATYPHVVCGLKRGFSYFHHTPGQPYVGDEHHSRELLLAASGSDREGDTHWLRADVDQFLALEAIAAGITYLDQSQITLTDHGDRWRIAATRLGQQFSITAKFVIDATGEAALLSRTLGIGCNADGLQTSSRALFGHFREVPSWRNMLERHGSPTHDHPFCCDDAALHHVIEEGWMWQLRFNNGITSVGFALDTQATPGTEQHTPQQEWDRLLAKYPSLQEQLSSIHSVTPPGPLIRTPRMQRRAAQCAGQHWALLPNTAGFIDPLHSTGIAHTLCGIERLAAILQSHWDRSSLAAALQNYARTLHDEIGWIDQLVANCYAARGDFALFNAATMLYFTVVTRYEQCRLRSAASEHAFLSANDRDLQELVARLSGRLREHVASGIAAAGETFYDEVAAAIGPFNSAGLCDRSLRNMYTRTAMPV